MLVRTAQWLDPQQRRLETLRALQERDWPKLLELVSAYVLHRSRKQARTSPHTLRAYQTGILDFLEWVWPQEAPAPRIHLHQDPSERLRGYGLHLQERPPLRHRKHGRDGGVLEAPKEVKATTVQGYMAGVRVLFRALEWAGVRAYPEGELVAPPDPRPPESRRAALPEVSYRQLLELLEGEAAEQVRLRLVVQLTGRLGLRISEMCGLRVEDLDLAHRLVEVRGKGGKTRLVPLPKGMLPDLRLWLKLRRAHARAGEEALIVNLGNRRAKGLGSKPDQIRKQLERLYQELGLAERYYGAHMLRHTAGTRLYSKNGRDLLVTARTLGHANLNTAAIYAKLETEGLIEAMDRANE